MSDNKFITSWFYASLATETKPAGFLGMKTKEVYTERHVDFSEFARKLQHRYEALDRQGYDVINVVPVAMGQSEPYKDSRGNYIGDAGFSITRGAVVVGKKRES